MNAAKRRGGYQEFKVAMNFCRAKNIFYFPLYILPKIGIIPNKH